MKCPECKKEFISLSINQKYCCANCGNKYRKKHSELVHFPVISFYCAYCGKSVVTDGKMINVHVFVHKYAKKSIGGIHHRITVQ